MKELDKASQPKEHQSSPTNMSLNNSEKLPKYFSEWDYVWFTDEIDEKCPNCCCQDTKKRVARENQGLGPIVGFG